MNFLTKLVRIAYTWLLILSVICITAAQDPCAVDCSSAAGPLTEKCIDCKITNVDYKDKFDSIKDEIDFAGIIEDYINDYGIGNLVKDHIGMSIAGLIVVIIIVLSLPSLIIIGCLFACCWACNCCCFSKKYARHHDDQSHIKQKHYGPPPAVPTQFTPVSMPPPMNRGHVRSRSFSSSPTGPDPINNFRMPRFTTKKPMEPPQQFNSYDDDYHVPPSAWRNRTSGHFNPNFQQQEWGDF